MKKLIVANFKMNEQPGEVKQYFIKFASQFTGVRADVVICPTFVNIPLARFLTEASPVKMTC